MILPRVIPITYFKGIDNQCLYTTSTERSRGSTSYSQTVAYGTVQTSVQKWVQTPTTGTGQKSGLSYSTEEEGILGGLTRR